MINLRRHWFDDDYKETISAKDLGITWQKSVGQTMGDQTWYFDCDSVPENLPEGWSIIEGELEKLIGWGLTYEDVQQLKGKTQYIEAANTEVKLLDLYPDIIQGYSTRKLSSEVNPICDCVEYTHCYSRLEDGTIGTACGKPYNTEGKQSREHNSPIVQELLNEITPEQMKATEREMELIAFAFFILNHYNIKDDDGYHYVNSMNEYTTIHKLIQHYLEDDKKS